MTAPITIDVTMDTGQVIRFALLSTHYRKPVEIGAAAMREARNSLRRLILASEPTHDPVPEALIAELANDLNTPGAIALMHAYRKNKEGRKLFASLKFLGFLQDVTVPEEVRDRPPGAPFTATLLSEPARASSND